MNYYIIWYNEEPEKENEDYLILQAESIEDAKNKAEHMFGDYVISVERYNP